MDSTTVLSELQAQRAQLEAMLEEVGEARMSRPGVQDGWTVKDLIFHIAAWDRRGTSWIRQVVRGETPQIPEPGMTWEDMDRINERELVERRQRPLPEALAEFREAYAQLLEVIEGLSDEDLDRSAPHSYPDGDWVGVRQLVRWRYAHYASHGRAIRHWLDSSASKEGAGADRADDGR